MRIFESNHTRSLRIFCSFILTLFFFPSPLSAGDGYRITVRYENGIGNNIVEPGKIVYLYLYRWGEKIPVDSARISEKGTVVFRGRRTLEPGEYVAGLNPEFFVSAPGKVREDFTLVYSADQKDQKKEYGHLFSMPEIRHNSGSPENGCFTGMQNLVNYQWKQYPDNAGLQRRFEELSREAARRAPGSLLDISLRNLLARRAPRLLATIFPHRDERLVNTNFAKKDIESFFKAIELNPPDTIIRYTDRLIGHTDAGTTPEGKSADRLQARIAASGFDYFYNSRIMGQEAVAVHIAEHYFLNGKLDWPDEEGLFLMNSFVQLNKHSLTGMDAPELNLIDTSGNRVSLRDMPGEYTILYFYTDNCASCKIETPKLVDFVNEYKDGVLNVYTVYTQSDPRRWKEYIRREFGLYNPFIEWRDVYDPEFDSGFHLLYNVVSTPQMFLLDKDKKIIGRNLKTDSLKELLEVKKKERDDLHVFFGNFFNKLAPDGKEAVKKGIDAFYEKSIRDTNLFREIFRELYVFLKNNDDYTLQEGAAYLGETYIASKPELWPDRKFPQQVARAVELFNMNPLGSKAQELILRTPDGSSLSFYDIGNKYKILYFYNFNCGLCTQVSEELKKFYPLYRDKAEIVAVYTGKDYNNWVKYILNNNFAWQNVWDGDSRGEIYKKYNLESVPAIYLLDENNIVLAKDINPYILEELLKRLFPPENKTN